MSRGGSSPVNVCVRSCFCARRSKRAARVECALDAAVAIEILHNYSLVHDDIEDGDELRHGRTTIWKRFGVPHGINAGDALCAISYSDACCKRKTHALPCRSASSMMLHVLHEANLQMCEGQGLDIGFETSSTVTMAQYLEMIAGKTGALFSASCELGALAAGCERERARTYAAARPRVRSRLPNSRRRARHVGRDRRDGQAERRRHRPAQVEFSDRVGAGDAAVARPRDRGARLRDGRPHRGRQRVGDVIARARPAWAREPPPTPSTTAPSTTRIALAGEARIDRRGTIRDFFAEGARRVA